MKKSALVFTLTAFSVLSPLFAETYYWAGGGADTNWTTVGNWRTGSESGTVAAAYPTAGDTAYIAGDWTVNVDADITVSALNIQRSSPNLTDDWTTNLTGSGKLTFGAMDFNRASATDGVIGTLEIDCDAECSGTLFTHSGTKLLIDGGKTLKAGALTHTATNSIPKSLIEVVGTLQAGTIDLQGGGNIGCNALSISSDGTVTASQLKWAAGGTYNNDGNALENAGTLILSGTLYATGPAVNSGTMEIGGGGSIKSLSCSASGASITFNGDNEIESLLIESGGGSLEINGTQKIQTLKLEGSSAASPLTISGSGSIELASDQSAGKCLKVARSLSITPSSFYYKASDSSFDTGEPYGVNNNWILLNDSMLFEWTGSIDTDWAKNGNWNYNLVPGLANALDGTDTRNYSVLIPDSPSGNPSNFPVAAATYSVKDLQIGQNAPSPSTLELSTSSNLAQSGNLLNYGKITYSSSGRITKDGAYINDTTCQGTVVFDGTTTATDISAVQYYNLISNGGGNRTAATALTVLNDLEINGSGVFTANGAATISNALKVNSGSVYFNNGADGSASSAATATFATTESLSLGNSAGDSFSVTSGALVLPATLGGLTLGGTISASGGITLSKDAALSANTIFASATSLASPVKLTASSALTVTTNAPLTTSAANTLTLTNASLANAAAVTGGNIIFEETALKPHQIFTPHAASTYQRVEVNKTSGGEWTANQSLNADDFVVTKNGTLTTSGTVNATNFTITDNNIYVANAPVNAANFSITKNANATFNELATITTACADAPSAGNITFAKGCSFTPAATFNTTGTLTLNGGTNPCAFTGGLTHTAGPTVLFGALNATNSAISLGAATLAANITIDAGSGSVSFAETLDGAFSFTSNGTGLLTLGGLIGGTTPPTRLTAAGPVAINAAAKINGPITIEGATTVTAASITTPTDSTGLQLYKDDITFNSSCAVTGTVQAAAGIITNGAHSVTFTNDLWLYTNSGNAKDSTLGGGTATPSLDIKGNIFIAKNGQASTVASAINSAKNILLLHGTLNANAALSADKDIIMLGAAYNIDDTNETAASQTAGLFAYNHASRKSAASYTEAFPTACPDGTAISSSYTASANISGGAEVSAGQNFYANGLSILGSGAWTLTLPNNDSQNSAFAELYNSTITNCHASQKVAAAENNAATSCENVIASRPIINEAWTVYDDGIYVAFVDSNGDPVTIENSGNEISAAAAAIFSSAGAYAGTYTDADFQTSTDGKGDIAGGFYIKSSVKWNTDAKGTSAGSSESSDRSGSHRETIPYLNIPKALDSVYETLRDSSKNRIAHYYSAAPDTSGENSGTGKTFTAVADKCAPVLTQVLSGQELHKEPASQADCDAHNFIEFIYSEPVDISGGTTSVASDEVNKQAGGDLGATTNNSSGITFAGLGTTVQGKIEAALKSGSGSPHALYRNFSTAAAGAEQDQPCRIRVSIAGYVDGSVSAGGNSYKNWAGYISSGTSPSGTITRIANPNIKDKSTAQNSLSVNSSAGHPLPTLSVQNSENELYGPWDVTPPSFAPIRINGSASWSRPATDGSQEYEFVGASYSTGTLSAIELHWFDNEPSYTENRQWFSRAGWGDASSATEYSSLASYAADIRGGSRPDSSGDNATKGGIRYCSLYDAYGAFKYAVEGSGSYSGFTQNIKGGAESSLFTYAGEGGSSSSHSTGGEDGLYCKLVLDDTSLQLKTTFILEFDSDACCVTDLAGNRIQCGKIKMKTIDRTTPDFTLTAVPLGTKKMLVIFSKALNIGNLALYDSASVHTNVSALEYIPKALALNTASGTGIEIDQSVPATCAFRTNNSTGLVVTLNQNAVLTDITSGVFVNSVGVNKYDPLSGISATITYIQDSLGNYIEANKKHAFSDFAVNAVQAQYAYDNTLTDSGFSTDYSLYEKGAWAVRDWNAEQGNYGSLSAGNEYIMQCSLYDGTNDKSGGLDPATGQLPSGALTCFFDSAPDSASVSTKINENTNLGWRIWHPNQSADIFTSLAPVNNNPQLTIDGTANDAGVVFDIAKEDSKSKWKGGDQVSFLFKMGDFTVDHYANGTNFPLYAVRLKDINNPASLDLWSFKLKTTTAQRGGVTILNNVINVDNGENTVIQVDMKEAGNLNVMVMTLDGNIVTYLRHGHTDAGTHYYNWNGTNNSGSKVARGLYFVRVIGPGIDETRKIMCVK